MHCLLQYSTYFQLLFIHMQPLFGQFISHLVFCLLLWPDDTKCHALSLSSWVLLKPCYLMGTKPLPGQIHTTSNKWLAISKLSEIWSSWRSTAPHVFISSQCSRRLNYFIALHHVPGVLLSSFGSNPHASCSLCKIIYSLSWSYLERKSQIWPYMYIYIQPTKAVSFNIFWKWDVRFTIVHLKASGLQYHSHYA